MMFIARSPILGAKELLQRKRALPPRGFPDAVVVYRSDVAKLEASRELCLFGGKDASFLHELYQMGKHGQSRGRAKPGIEPDIDTCNHFRNGRDAVAQAGK